MDRGLRQGERSGLLALFLPVLGKKDKMTSAVAPQLEVCDFFLELIKVALINIFDRLVPFLLLLLSTSFPSPSPLCSPSSSCLCWPALSLLCLWKNSYSSFKFLHRYCLICDAPWIPQTGAGTFLDSHCIPSASLHCSDDLIAS